MKKEQEQENPPPKPEVPNNERHTVFIEVPAMEDKIKMYIDSLPTYEQQISKYADSMDPQFVTNSGREHAIIILKNLYRTASEIVRVFAKDLKGVVANGYIDELVAFIRNHPHTKLDVKLESLPNKDYEPIQKILELKREFKDRVNIGKVTEASLNEIEFNKKRYHFTIGDKRMFRFETDVDNYTAVASFNSKEFCQQLIGTFDSLKTEPYTV